MSFLLDTDICSAYLRGAAPVGNRFIQYSGRLYVSSLSIGELFTWTLRSKAPTSRMQNLLDMLSLANRLDIDLAVARKFGELDAYLLDRGRPAPDLDLFNSAVAMVHGLTLVTHNVRDYEEVPELIIEDWLAR